MSRVFLVLVLSVLTACASPSRALDAGTQRSPISVAVTGSGPPVVLIPGLGCPGAVWDETVARLKDRYTCHVVTLAGFDGQPAVPAPLLASARDALIAYIRERGLQAPALVGHSLGAFLAMSVAVKEPSAASRILAVDGVPFLPAVQDESLTAEQGARIGERIRAQLAGLTREQYQAQAVAYARTHVTAEADVQRVASWAKDVDPVAAGDALAELFSTDLRADLARVQIPLLLLGSNAGDDANNAIAEGRYRAQISQAPSHKFVHFKDSLHFIMFDARDRFLPLTEAFLRCGDLSSCPL